MLCNQPTQLSSSASSHTFFPQPIENARLKKKTRKKPQVEWIITPQQKLGCRQLISFG